MKLIFSRHPLSQTDFDNPWYALGIIPGIIADVTKSSTPKSPGLPAIPSMTDAKSTAQDAQTSQRQAALRAGAATNVTGGSGIVLGSDVSSLTLVGSS